MKQFESFLASKMEEYIAYRQNMGYSKKSVRSNLLTLDRYFKKKNADWSAMQPGFFLELRSSYKGTPRTVNAIISRARSFFYFLMRQECYNQNPLEDIPPLPERTFVPFVLSPEETDQLLAAVCRRIRKIPKFYLKDCSIYIAILLLARCGMRISEPLKLLFTHYRSDDGTLYIKKTKFRKDRLIPAPKATMVELENYLAMRSSLLSEDQNSYLLAGDKQKGLNDHRVRMVFNQAIDDIGLKQQKQIIGNITFGSPTPHSLRHGFAINTLKRIRDQGKSTQRALPVLSAFMGHRKYQYTGAYLKVSDAKHRQGLINFARSQLETI